MQRHRDVVPVGGEHAAAQAVGRARSRWHGAGRRGGPTAPPALAPAAANCSGDVTSISSTSGSAGSLRAVRRVSERARPAPERTISAPSSWASRATAKAREASVSTPVIRSRFPSRSPTAPARLCEGRGVHVGILGGTGPAGRGVAVRLAEAGGRVTIGSRTPSGRRRGRRRRGRWPGSEPGPARGGQRRGAAGPTLVVVATPWDSADLAPCGPCGSRSPARWSSPWPTPWSRRVARCWP